MFKKEKHENESDNEDHFSTQPVMNRNSITSLEEEDFSSEGEYETLPNYSDDDSTFAANFDPFKANSQET